MKMWGDGQAVKATNDSIFNRLAKSTLAMATIDGYKCSLLEKAYNTAIQKRKNIFCVIGHPKLATLYSVSKLAAFCTARQESGDEFVTISQLL